MTYVLYAAQFSRSQLVEMVMAEGGIDYQTHDMRLGTTDHRSAEFLAENPMGWIPALKTDDGEVIGETPAINFYLAERHGLTDLVPAQKDPLRGRFLMAFHNVIGEIEPVMKRVFYPARYAVQSEGASGALELAWQALEERLALIEPVLAQQGPYFLGDRYSLADLTLAYWTVYARIRRGMAAFPATDHALDLVRSRPAISRLFEQHIAQTESRSLGKSKR